MFAEPINSQVSLLALHQQHPERYPFLLESTSGAHAQGCFDILFGFPGESLQLQDGRLSRAWIRDTQSENQDFLQALDHWFEQDQQTTPNPHKLPFLGGWFFYLGYELAGQVEPCLQLPPARSILPTAMAVRCPAAVIRNRANGALYLVAESEELLQQLQIDLQDCQPLVTKTLPKVHITEDDPQRYLEQIDAVQKYIRSGDVFQVNLSREWQGHLAKPTPSSELYASLRASNPAPFSGLMCWQGSAVISSSPERLLRLQDGYAQTRPIAGTRPRTGGDAAMTKELLAHPKERAEHVMLIDLERNDLGRICEYGSVQVDELMTAESYAQVHHIVSNIRGKVRVGVGSGAALRAVFPGGTITGCPKVRCMQIIAELEGQGRGAYTGAMGYLGLDGRLDSNILIRTLVQHQQDLWLRAGGGIVSDSVPANELDETRVKARAVLMSLGAAL